MSHSNDASDTDSDEARRLFRESVGEVRRVESDTVRSRPPKPKARRAQPGEEMARALEDDFDLAELETGEELIHARDGVAPRTMRKLRRGQFSVQAELDLHEMNREAARNSIKIFLDQCQATGLGCVKIIHGKGLRSRGRGPVIKTLTGQLLRRSKAVNAFASCKPEDGGTGAVYVLLRKPRRK